MAGLDVSPEALNALFTVDPQLWRQELADIGTYLAQFGSRLPPKLLRELDVTNKRLG